MKYYRRKETEINYEKENYTKCWTCKNACNSGCEWSREFKPVPGWDAIKTFIPSNGKCAASYHVISCPKYIQD